PWGYPTTTWSTGASCTAATCGYRIFICLWIGFERRQRLEHRLARAREAAGARALELLLARGAGALGAEHADADGGIDLHVLARAVERIEQNLERVGQGVDEREDAPRVHLIVGLEAGDQGADDARLARRQHLGGRRGHVGVAAHGPDQGRRDALHRV